MEEKLYFQPAKYGNGQKKKTHAAPKTADKEVHKKGKNHKAVKLVCFLLFLAVIVFIILYFLRGKTTTTGQFPANVRNESLVCQSSNIAYKKVSNIDSPEKTLKINMIFNGTDSLSSASLKYTLAFASYSEAYSAEAISHAQFNLGLQSLGYDASKFNNKFSILDNVLDIVVNFSSSTTIDEVTKDYLLVEETSNGNLPITLSEYQHNYEQQGFTCTSTINN
ncbi:hypothetical protein IJH29_01235 [Candidatus Saccharibacteria bacterium]|nr:hypothetical protein [Candidatus Saccharibacteria bacterium]